MNDNDDLGRFVWTVTWIILFMLVCLLMSCKTVYVPVPGETKTEYVYKESRDTSYIRDSVYIKEVQKGDTVRITEYRDRYRFRYVSVHDTITRVDSVAVPYPVEVVKVDHKQTWLQKTFMLIGIGFILGIVIRLVIKRLRLIG